MGSPTLSWRVVWWLNPSSEILSAGIIGYHFHWCEPKILDFGLASKALLVSPGNVFGAIIPTLSHGCDESRVRLANRPRRRSRPRPRLSCYFEDDDEDENEEDSEPHPPLITTLNHP
jgi:hypothetical protein